jgi:hypothetical protein
VKRTSHVTDALIQVREAQVADGGGQAEGGVRDGGAGSGLQEATGGAGTVDAEGGGQNEGHRTGARQP